MHAVVPFEFVHAAPQPEQFATVPSVVSHPLPALLSQLPKPLVQTMVQAPSEHDGVPLVVLHALPQPPQWLTFVCVLASQPLLAWPSQLPNEPLHAVSRQVPVAHDSVALARLQV